MVFTSYKFAMTEGKGIYDPKIKKSVIRNLEILGRINHFLKDIKILNIQIDRAEKKK